MPFTGLVLLFVLFLAVLFIIIGAAVYRQQRDTLKKTSLLVLCTIFLQLTLFLLFFTGALASFNSVLEEILWWLIVLGGLAFGIRECKTNIIAALLSIFLSVLLTILMLLMLFVTSM
ncbi:hypothetical protein GCM10008986_31940 [Salinibacillus aidingensis]|uniref:YesK-like protein n=1 Tax=Salinibacillus aidingensis TaxID=237684 RepID=A0ABN1BNN7_9BACI